MNKQILNKILIVILLTVWSFVGYRFVSSFGLSKQADLSNTTAINPIPKVQSKRAAFRLGVINRDPFLNTFNRVETKSESPGRTVKSISEPKESRWPNIEYFGFVQNESSKNPLVLLKINNKIKRMRQGELFEDLVVINIYGDSVRIVKGKEKRIFQKQQ